MEHPPHGLMIGELAKRSGVTDRTLRHYENVGLMAPARTGSGQRVYKEKDLLRLQEIQLLKRAGFTLSAIRNMTAGQGPSASTLMEAQLQLMRDELERLSRAIEVTSLALRAVEAGAPVDLSSLCLIINQGEETMSEEKRQEVYSKYYTEEEKEAWKQAGAAVSAEELEGYNARWMAVIARAEKAKEGDPASEEALAIAREWNALLKTLEDMNPLLLSSASKIYDDRENIRESGGHMPFSEDVYAFVGKAQQALKEKGE